MNTATDTPPAAPAGPAPRASFWKTAAIWGLFLAAVYLAAPFFLLIFLTFLFSYTTLGVVDAIVKRGGGDAARPWLRRPLTVAVLLLIPAAALGGLWLVGRHLVGQAQHLSGYLSQADPEAEITHRLEEVVGPALFRQLYGGPGDPRYQQGLDEFRATGRRYVAEYDAFPRQEARVESGFNRRFAEETRARLRPALAREGTSSQAFEQWIAVEKYPELHSQAQKHLAGKGRAGAMPDPLHRLAVDENYPPFLAQVRKDPVLLARLRAEWIADTLDAGVKEARDGPAYAQEFREYYEEFRARQPQALPYPFDRYEALKKARAAGPAAFATVMDALNPGADPPARLRADFEAAQRQELFHQWWATSSGGKLLREQVVGRMEGFGGVAAEWVERLLQRFLDLPFTIATAFLLSVFLCIDFPQVQAGLRTLRQTWLRDAYDEVVPALVRLADLIAKSFQAQALISLCNAGLMLIGLEVLGVDHALVLAVVTFLLCLIPVVGVFLATAPVLVVALLQEGGGILLAAEVIGVVLLVHLVETFFLNPRIVGKLLDLHPVLVVSILPVAEFFFGIWGVLLSTPVAVYLITEIIYRESHPPAAGEKPPGKVAAAPSG